MSAIPMPLAEHEIARALEIAREMARAGVPLFVAAPAPGTKVGYALPPAWETTTADPAAVDQWRPGWALCAVGGHVCDFLDTDPRNGGHDSFTELRQAGTWPRSYGVALTPSGGTHNVIAPLGVGKGELVAGVDLQGGRSDGSGRGFVFIAPTVRASKVDGVARAYRWDIEPKLAELAAQRPWDTSGAGLAKLLPVKRSKINIQAAKPGSFDALLAQPESDDYARRSIDNAVARVAAAARPATWGGHFHDVLRDAAYLLGRYCGVPYGQQTGYLDAQLAYDMLCAAIRESHCEPDSDDEDKIESGLRKGSAVPIVVQPSVQRLPLDQETTQEASSAFGDWLYGIDDLDDLPEPEPLIADWLYQNTLARLVGQSNAGKSFVALDMACCVATGRPWHGRAVTQTNVLYVVGEGLSGYRKRLAAWCEHNNVDRAELRAGLRLTPSMVQVGSTQWRALEQWAVDTKAHFIIIDTQARATEGTEENSNSEQGAIIGRLSALRTVLGGTLMLLHHTGNTNGEAADRARGAYAWRAGVDTELVLTKTGDKKAVLRNDKQRDAESGQEVSVDLVRAAGSLAVTVGAAAPLRACVQWLADQVADGVRFEAANAVVKAIRDAGHKIGNGEKAWIMGEYHKLVGENTGLPSWMSE